MSESDSDDSYTATEHWGEIPKLRNHTLPDVSEDIKKSMQPDCLSFYPDDENVMQIQDIVFPEINPLVMYWIQLHKWMNNITEKIRNLKKPGDSSTHAKEVYEYEPIPPMPEVKAKHVPNNLNFIPVSSVRKSVDIDYEVPELSEPILKQILAKCVAIMTAQIGFEDSFQSVLDVMVDVLEQFYTKVCNRFVEALHEEEQLNAGGFPNVLERMLIEMGLGGAKGLHNYYQCRVVKYVGTLLKRCKKLETQYFSLRSVKPSSPTGQFGSWFNVTVKEEDVTMDIDPEMINPEDLITNEYDLLRNLDSAAADESAGQGGEVVMYSS